MNVRKILLALGILAIVSLIALVVLPFLFRDRVIALAKTELEERVHARIDWSRIRLSLLRDFPNLTLGLHDLTIAGKDRFATDTLASTRHVQVVLDLGSVVGAVRRGEQIVVRSVELDRPVLHLRVLPDGAANWQIFKSTANKDSARHARAFNIGLRKLELSNAQVVLDNAPAKLFVSLVGLEHELAGDFTRERAVLQAKTHADELTVRFAGVPYLNGVRVDARADIDADMVQRKFTFRENGVRLNELKLGLSGSVQQVGEQLALDLVLDAPRTEFRHILSLVPQIYARDFKSLLTSGGVAVSGQVKGAYGPKTFPAFALQARVDSAQFRYPDLPLPARDIFVDLSIDNAGHDLDSTVVNLKRFRMELGGEPITASMILRTPLSDPEMALRVDGMLDLGAANRTLKLDGIRELSGQLAADVSVRTRMSDLDAAQYDRVSARGTASLRNLMVQTVRLPHAIAVAQADLQLAPSSAKLTSFRGTIGSSDVQLTGAIENVFGFILRREDLRGEATLKSKHFRLDEWRSQDAARKLIPVPPRLDFTFAATIDRLQHADLELHNARGTVHVKNERLTLQDFRFNTLGGEIAMSGFYETIDTARPTFDMKVGMENLDIPGAFAQFVTVQRLAPVAQYTQGSFSADLALSGVLGDNLQPLLNVLTGKGSVLTSRVALREFPALNRLADGLRLQQLKNPELDTIATTVEIRNGRLHVQPFALRIGDARMNVAGWNSVDQSLRYTIELQVPRTALGQEGDRVVASLIAQTGRTGIELEPTDVVQLGVQVDGTVKDPSITTSFSGVANRAREALSDAVARELGRRAEASGPRVDSTAEEARRRVQAERDRLVKEAEERAAAVRAEAAKLAESVRREGHERADQLLASATNPVARAAARAAADRLRKEADDRAAQIVREAEERANGIVAEAQAKAIG